MSAMAQAQKKKAEAYMADAVKAASKKSWFSSSKERAQEEAAELYLQAANAYKVGGLLQEAGETYVKAGEIYRDVLKSIGEAAKSFSQAGACFKKANPVDAVQAYQSAISLLTDAGRLNQAAKLCKECAELYENDEVEVAESSNDKSCVVLAMEYYEQAAQLFEMEDAKSQASACQAKIAELASAALDPPDLIRAASIYEDLGRKCLDSNLLKFNAKAYFLQAVFCHLANSDAIGAQQALGKYENLDYTFGDSREGKFCTQLVECVDTFDAESFATACMEYDRISKLDPWKTTMLVKVKRGISEAEDEEDDVDLT